MIIGVLAGPSVVNCFNAEGGIGQCLRGEMVNSGLLPQPALATIEPSAPVQAPRVSPVPEPQVAIAEPALNGVDPAAAAPDALVAATLGLLRAEPDGSVVIAGSGTPGSEVEIYANENLLGSTTVEPSGDWVLVPDAPLPPGGLEITLGEAGKPGRAEESFVVAINEDGFSEPLVVASTPGAASQVLQGLKTAPPDIEIAAADPAAPSATVSAPAPLAPSAPPASPAAEPADDLASAEQSGVRVAPQPVQAEPVAPPEVPLATPPQAPVPDVAQGTVEPANPAPPPAEIAAAPNTAASPMPPEASASPSVAGASNAPVPASPEQGSAAGSTTDPAATPPIPADGGTPPSIDAIEIEGDRTFFAGAGPEGADIRLYVDDVFIADAKVSDGRWLVEAGPVLKEPSQRVRIDMLQPGTAEVASRAEVDFVIQLP
ncbi:MAG: LysM peptidoglycan-binding protein, partial [Devosia sp.]|nr:LysM peptidoglycan-binding protein [Devosia sp.]